MRHLLWSSCLLVVALVAVAACVHAAPPPGPAAARRAPVYLPGEKALLERCTQLARPLDLSRYASLLKPRVVDYSDLVTYVRCQDYGGGCMMYASLHAADIVGEWQAPYTPDLSWQYALRSWDEQFNARLATNAQAPGPDLTDVFRAGVASEGLCRSESDYLTLVSDNSPAFAIKDYRRYYDPAPTAEAREQAGLMKFEVTDSAHAITPSVDTLKTLLLTHGPVWAEGGWWWNGAHAMCFVGYDDNKQEFKGLNSQGDWADDHGLWTIPYDKLTSYVSALRTVDVIPTDRYQGRWAYSSRLRIRGTWRGTWTVNIGVQGQVPETVYRSYGRLPKMPYCYGERLDLDVPLPAYAAQFWPPKQSAKWYLQVEDNDRDGQTGQVIEWILARRYEDPNCGSVDQLKTQTFKLSQPVTVPDATGDPVASPTPSPYNAAPPTRNSQPGKAMIYLPEGAATGVALQSSLLLQSQIAFDLAQCSISLTGQAVLPGRLTSVAGPGLAKKTVDLCQLVASANVNKPPTWQRLAQVQTDAQGNFQFQVKLPLAGTQVLGAAYRGADGVALCSTKPLVRSNDPGKWRVEENRMRLLRDLPRPWDLSRPQPRMPRG